MSEHTKGKLVYHSGMIWKPDGSEDGIPIARMDRDTDRTTPTERDRNAERLTACWNACEGINPEAVPELLEALQVVTSLIGNVDHSAGNGPRSAKMRGDLLNDIRTISEQVIKKAKRR